MTRIDRIEKKDYIKLNESRGIMDKYYSCPCGKHFTRKNKTAHYKTQFHKDFATKTGYNIDITKKKIQKKHVEYTTEYITIWGTYKD